MASTRSPDDYLAPFGLLRPSMFPEESDLSEKVSKYIDEAELKAAAKSGDELDIAVDYWVYGKAFLAAHVDYNSNPLNNVLADQGSESFTQDQIKNWKTLSDEFFAKFNNLMAAITDKFGNVSRTQAVNNQVVW